MRLSGIEKYLLLIIFLSQLLILLGVFLNSIAFEISFQDAYRISLSESIVSIVVGGLFGLGVFLYTRTIISNIWQHKAKLGIDLFKPSGLDSDWKSFVTIGALFAILLSLAVIVFLKSSLNTLRYVMFYIMWAGFGIFAFCTAFFVGLFIAFRQFLWNEKKKRQIEEKQKENAK